MTLRHTFMSTIAKSGDNYKHVRFLVKLFSEFIYWSKLFKY